MNKKLGTFLLLIVIVFSSQSGSSRVVTVNEPIQKMAVIIDSPEFYHSSFVDDVLNGLSLINQTYNIDYDIYQLTDFEMTSVFPLKFLYQYEDSEANHTELTINLINSGNYDLIVLMGYMLRYNFLDFSEYPDMNFLFYDLSGENPYSIGSEFPDNLYVVGFQEHHAGYIAGSLAVQEYGSLPEKVAMIAHGDWDPRSAQLIAGFQAAIFRNTINIDILINYIDYPNYYYDVEKVRSIGTDLTNLGYDLIFSAFQANHTLELIQSFTGGDVICVDLNQSRSVMKNNTLVLLDVFSRFNDTQGFDGKKSALYGINDGVFYGNGWNDPIAVNRTIAGLSEDFASNIIPIPSRIKVASNTPGFNIIAVLFTLVLFPVIGKKVRKRK